MNEREDDDLIRTPLHISSSKGNVVLTLLLIWVRSNCSIYFTINKHCNRALTPLSYTILYCTVLYYTISSGHWLAPNSWVLKTTNKMAAILVYLLKEYN